MLVSNWRAVLKHAWSLRLMAAVVIFSVLELVLPALDDGTHPAWLFPVLTGLAGAGGFVARLVAQSKVPPVGDPR
jgi:hypothetical protein